jgi:hypothetical protein
MEKNGNCVFVCIKKAGLQCHDHFDPTGFCMCQSLFDVVTEKFL